MKIKKIALLLIVLLMFNQTMGFASTYIPADVKGTEYEEYFKLLDGLSIMSSNDDGTFLPNSNITRSEFVQVIANIIETESYSGTSSFVDVIDEDVKKAVEKLTQLGIINGNGNMKFFPDDSLLAVDGFKILLTTMGYQSMAEGLGGYPNGYFAVARKIGLSNNIKISKDGYLTRGETAKLIVRALDLPVATAHSYALDGTTYYTDKNKTLLSEVAGIYKEDGIVSANSIFSLEQNINPQKESIVIDGNYYSITDTQHDNMVGYNVNCYYRKIKDTDERVIVYMYLKEGKNDVLEINAADMIDITGTDVLYNDEKSNKHKKIKLSSSVQVIYNGKIVKEVNEGDFIFENGNLIYIDNDRDGQSDLVWIWEYTNMFISDITDLKIYDKYEQDKNIDLNLSNYDSFKIYDIDKNLISVSDLAKEDVLSVYISKDKKVLTGIQSTTTVNGRVSTINFTTEGQIVEIDGKKYNVGKEFTAIFPTEIIVGTEGVFYLDFKGQIYTVCNGKIGQDSYGYLIQCKLEKGLDDRIELKVLEENGKVSILEMADKPIIDSLKMTDCKKAIIAVRGGVLNPIIYQKNNEGKVIKLDTIKVNTNDENDMLVTKAVNRNGRYKNSTMVFEGRLPIDKETVVFFVPSNPETASEKHFGCGSYRYFQNDTFYYRMSSYTKGDDTIAADIMVMRDTNMSSSSGVCLVDEVSQCLTEDGLYVNKIYVYENDNYTTYTTEDINTLNKLYKIETFNTSADILTEIDYKDLKQGDVVKFIFNKQGEISKVAVVYSGVSDTMFSVNPYQGDFHLDVNRYIYGEASKVVDGLVEMPVDGEKQYYNLNNGSILAFNKEKIGDKIAIEKCSVSDIKAGSKLIVITKGGDIKYTIVFR